MHELILRLAHRLKDVDREAWDAVANPSGVPMDPFLSWDFLEALEASKAVCDEEGWSPRHLLIEESETGKLRAAMPLYVKMHSYGEFVFDHSWADAIERAGGRYYPKLLAGIPFTPVTGRRRLVRPDDPERATLMTSLLAGAVQIAQDNDLSSLHLNFLGEDEARTMKEAGMLMRSDQQFHFTDRGFGDFDGFLGALSSQKRKNLRKERLRAQDGLTFDWLTGDRLRPEHWKAFSHFYQDTSARKWGTPYLNDETFALLQDRMADRILMILANDNGKPIAGALNFIGSATLYGRYWGRGEERPFLHFEVCYYQAIDFALANGLSRVEAGAQGGHKLARGYEPVKTHSAHWIAHEGLRNAVATYLKQETAAVSRDFDYLKTRTPFKKPDNHNASNGDNDQ